MRILSLSDLHLEFQRDEWRRFLSELYIDDVDVVALCGDICSATMVENVLKAFAGHFASAQILYVTGNHEYYGANFDLVRTAARKAEKDNDRVTWLDGDITEVDGQRFLGHTLWYPLYGNEDGYWSDFRLIADWPRIGDKAMEARQWLDENLREDDIVLSHMLPSPLCTAPKWRGNPTNRYFINDVTRLIEERKPKLWLHGHTHDTISMRIGATEVRCNPRGYWPNTLNRAFDPYFVIDTDELAAQTAGDGEEAAEEEEKEVGAEIGEEAHGDS